MGYRFKAENFQSWRKVSLDVEGFTCIVGPNNKGKTAIHRAIRGLIRNGTNEAQITKGCPWLELALDIDGKLITCKRKRTGGATYVVDGVSYSKMGRDVPEPVKELGFGLERLGNEELEPNFGTQFGGQFLLSSTPSTVHAFIGAFSSTEKLDAGLKVAKERLQENSSAAKALALNIQEIEGRLHGLRQVELQAAAYAPEIDRLDASIRVGQATVVAIETLMALRRSIEQKQAVLDAIVVPSINDAEQTYKRYGVLSQACLHTTNHKHLSRLLREFLMPSIQPAEHALARFEAASRAQASRLRLEQTAALLEQLPEVNADLRLYREAAQLVSAASRLIVHRTGLAKAQAAHDALLVLKGKWDSLRGSTSRYKAVSLAITGSEGVAMWAKDLERLHAQLRVAEAEQVRVRAEEQEYYRTRTLCAKCGKAIKAA